MLAALFWLATATARVAIPALLLALPSFALASAAYEAFCEDYAEDAVHMNKLADRVGCSASGPRWSDDKAHHRGWCQMAKQSSVEKEKWARRVELDKCYCWKYAARAVQQNEANKQMTCGFSGVQWHSNYGNHSKWCLGGDEPEFAVGQRAAGFVDPYPEKDIDYRAQMLEQCRRSKEPPVIEPPKVRDRPSERQDERADPDKPVVAEKPSERQSERSDPDKPFVAEKPTERQSERVDPGKPVVTQSPTGVATGTEGSLADRATASANCKSGFVWREARPSDLVCVTPEVRARTARENAEAAAFVDPDGAYGPNTCVAGYVWREAFEGDMVCVTPAVRDQVREDNRLAASRRSAGR